MASAVQERAALLKDDFATLDEVERQLAIYQQDLMPRLRVPHLRHRPDPARDGEARARILRRHDADRPRHGPVEPQPDAAGIRAAGRRRRAAADRTQGRRAGRLAGRCGPAAVAGRDHAPRCSGAASTRTGSSATPIPAASITTGPGSSMRSAGSRSARSTPTTGGRRRSELADGARNAVAAAAAVSAGALGLGAIVTLAATTAAADVTGIIMASVLAALGFFILPAKREKGKQEMRGKIAAVRQRLSDALHEQFAQRDRQERRTDPRKHRALQPIHQGRRGEAAHDRAGAAARLAPCSPSLQARIERPAA